MMNHDYAHCLDYVQGVCPPTCFRAELTEDYRKNCNLPVTWAHFSGTKECQYVPWKPTNGDKIRTMTDEELAEYIRVFFPEACPPRNCPGEDFCYNCWLGWLKQGAET